MKDFKLAYYTVDSNGNIDALLHLRRYKLPVHFFSTGSDGSRHLYITFEYACYSVRYESSAQPDFFATTQALNSISCNPKPAERHIASILIGFRHTLPSSKVPTPAPLP